MGALFSGNIGRIPTRGGEIVKILHLASEYPPQKVFGLGRFVHDIAVEAARQGHEVHVVTNSMSGKDFEICDQGVHVHRVHFPPPPKPADGTTTVVQFNTQVIERAVPLINQAPPDVINTHDWLTFLAGRSLNRIFKIPHVLTIHDTMIGKKFGKLDNPDILAANIEKCGCLDADITICCSEYIKKELISLYQAPAEKIRVIPCAVDEKNFVITSDAFLLENFRSVLASPQDVLVLYVGRLDPEKGLQTLLNAVPEILKVRRDVKFVLAGKGVMEESIRSWVQQSGLGEHVRLVGYIGGAVLSHLYKVSDIQVVPSTYEPFGIVALEGMVNGIPLIVANSGGLSEIVDGEIDGIKVAPDDNSLLADAILRLSNDANLRKCIGDAGREKALMMYNWQRITQLTLQVYLEVLRLQKTTPRTQSAISSPGKYNKKTRVSSQNKQSQINEEIHVVVDCTSISRHMTGIGRYTDSVTQKLSEIFQLTLLSTPGNTSYLSEKYPKHTVIEGCVEFELQFPHRQKAVTNLLNKEGVNADLYLGPMYDAPFDGNVPSITVIHDLSFLKYPEMLPPQLTEYTIRATEHAVQRSEYLVTVSKTIREEIIKNYNVDPDRIIIAPPGVDDCFENIPSVEEQVTVCEKYAIRPPFIMAVNLTNSRKNAERLFKAIKEVFKVQKDITLVVSGGWNLTNANLWRLAYDTGIMERVAITGYVSRKDLLAIYQQATVFCMPSLEEGFGIPVVEAMACGIPVVTSNRGALKEIAEGCAKLVDPESIQSITDGILYALEDQKFRDECVLKGKTKANNFTWDRTAEKIAHVIRVLTRN